MLKNILIVLFFTLANSNASQLALETETTVSVNLNELCPDDINNSSLNEEEKAYCQTLAELKLQNQGKDIVLKKKDQTGKPWKIRFYFGPTRTKYYATDVSLQTNDFDVTIHNIKPDERTSMKFYRVWERPIEDALRWIDEPTNTFILTLEKGPHEIGLHVFHPKYVFYNSGLGIHTENEYRVSGNINGQDVDEFMRLRVSPDEYDPDAPQLLFHRYENSHKYMNYSLRYAYQMPLLQKSKFKGLSYTAGATLGLVTGFSNSSYAPNNEYYGGVNPEHKKAKIMGAGFGLLHRLMWTGKKDKFGIFLENQHSFYKLNYDFVGGKAKHSLRSQTFTLGINIRLHKQKK